MRRKFVILIISIGILFLINIPYATADGGFVNPYPDLDFYQEFQRAIIVWNDGTEYMFLQLGLDAYFGNENTNTTHYLLHITPFPSLPKVCEANENIFKKLNYILKKKISQENIMQTFMYPWYEYKSSSYGNAMGGGGYEDLTENYIQIGAHSIGIFKINSINDVTMKITSFYKSKGEALDWTLSERQKQIFEYYIQENYNYFAFDFVNISEENDYKYEPLLYIFKTNKIYYPLKISFLTKQWGVSVKLYIITPNGVNTETDISNLNHMFGKLPITESELQSIDKRILNLLHFGYIDYYSSYYYRGGYDFVAEENLSNPYIFHMVMGSMIFIVLGVIIVLSSKLKSIIKDENRFFKLSFYVISFLIFIAIVIIFIQKILTPNPSIYVNPYDYKVYSYISKFEDFREGWYSLSEAVFIMISSLLIIMSIITNFKICKILGVLSAIFGEWYVLQCCWILPPVDAVIFTIISAIFLIIIIPLLLANIYTNGNKKFRNKVILGVGGTLTVISLISFYLLEVVIYVMLVAMSLIIFDLGKNDFKRNKLSLLLFLLSFFILSFIYSGVHSRSIFIPIFTVISLTPTAILIADTIFSKNKTIFLNIFSILPIFSILAFNPPYISEYYIGIDWDVYYKDIINFVGFTIFLTLISIVLILLSSIVIIHRHIKRKNKKYKLYISMITAILIFLISYVTYTLAFKENNREDIINMFSLMYILFLVHIFATTYICPESIVKFTNLKLNVNFVILAVILFQIFVSIFTLFVIYSFSETFPHYVYPLNIYASSIILTYIIAIFAIAFIPIYTHSFRKLYLQNP